MQVVIKLAFYDFICDKAYSALHNFGQGILVQLILQNNFPILVYFNRLSIALQVIRDMIKEVNYVINRSIFFIITISLFFV